MYESTSPYIPQSPYKPISSVTLILVVSDDAPSELHSTYLLEVIFAAMVLLIGLHELEDVSNKVERLKKELKVFFPNFDYLLNPSYSCHGFVSQVLNNKQLVDEVFGISGIIKVEVSMITLTEAEG